MSETAVMTQETKSPSVELSTIQFDPRFPSPNQTKYCYTSYLDYYRCQKARGVDYEPCNYFKYVFTAMCPKFWVEKWDTQREEGIFTGRI